MERDGQEVEEHLPFWYVHLRLCTTGHCEANIYNVGSKTDTHTHTHTVIHDKRQF